MASNDKIAKIDGESEEWRKLVKDLKTVHAQRMNDLLETMPDKQFRIVYPKLLEFIIPKMQRQEVIKTQNNYANILQIQVVRSPEQIAEYEKKNLENNVEDIFDISITETTEED